MQPTDRSNDAPPQAPLPPVSPALGAAASRLSEAAGALNADPNGESDDEYKDYVAINELIARVQTFSTKYQQLGR